MEMKELIYLFLAQLNNHYSFILLVSLLAIVIIMLWSVMSEFSSYYKLTRMMCIAFIILINIFSLSAGYIVKKSYISSLEKELLKTHPNIECSFSEKVFLDIFRDSLTCSVPFADGSFSFTLSVNRDDIIKNKTNSVISDFDKEYKTYLEDLPEKIIEQYLYDNSIENVDVTANTGSIIIDNLFSSDLLKYRYEDIEEMILTDIDSVIIDIYSDGPFFNRTLTDIQKKTTKLLSLKFTHDIDVELNIVSNRDVHHLDEIVASVDFPIETSVNENKTNNNQHSTTSAKETSEDN